MVQVFESSENGNQDIPLSFGLAVGDGTQILTVFNFENNLPDSLAIGLPGKTKYTASVQAIDPRTSMVLLKIKGTSFQPVDINDRPEISLWNNILVLGWTEPDYKKLEIAPTQFPGYFRPTLMGVVGEPYIISQGAVITDNQSKVIGLMGNYYNDFVYFMAGPGSTPPIMDIQNAPELLLPDAATQPWAKGPVYVSETYLDELGEHVFVQLPIAKYNEMTAALASLFNTVGDPVFTSQTPEDFRPYVNSVFDNPQSGKLLCIIYPGPVELHNTKGQVVAKAKWVAMQWDQANGVPNQILYGNIQDGDAMVAGAFLLNGDLTDLEKTLN